VPRYFLAFVVSAVYLPVAIAGSTHFYTVLSNFSSVLGYWQAIFIPPMILEAVIFRAPVSTKTYPIDAWDQPSKLPIGISAIVAGCCVSGLFPARLSLSPRSRSYAAADRLQGIPLIAACMAQAWWVGWIAQMIPGGE
jgi:purine-cytosine permease-like protein